jgi:hypothetical protein
MDTLDREPKDDIEIIDQTQAPRLDPIKLAKAMERGRKLRIVFAEEQRLNNVLTAEDLARRYN